MNDLDEPLFCYCLEIGEREFAIRVTREGVIHWDDYQERRRARMSAARGKKGGSVLMMAPDEFTVSFALSDDLFVRLRAAAAAFRAQKWTSADELQLDECLAPLFWERVNPHLAQPLSGPVSDSQ